MLYSDSFAIYIYLHLHDCCTCILCTCIHPRCILPMIWDYHGCPIEVVQAISPYEIKITRCCVFVVSVVSTFCLEEPFRNAARFLHFRRPPRSEQIEKLIQVQKALNVWLSERGMKGDESKAILTIMYILFFVSFVSYKYAKKTFRYPSMEHVSG